MDPQELLKLSLPAAVMVWVEKLKNVPLDDLMRRAPDIAQVIASRGDRLIFQGKKRGETAEVFEQVAEGVAILSFLPGGVDLFGEHFENQHPEMKK